MWAASVAVSQPAPALTPDAGSGATLEANPILQIDALVSQANSYSEAGTHWLALEAYSEALSISRRSDGLFNDTAIDLMDRMARMASAGGDPVLASEYWREAQRMSWRAREENIREIEETLGRNTTEHVEARLELAQWLLGQSVLVTFDDRGRPMRRKWQFDAYDIFDDVDKQIEKELDNDPALKVAAYRAKAEVFGGTQNGRRGVPTELLDARKFLERLDEPQPELHASVLVDIGDRVLSGRPESAAEEFVEAWTLLAETEAGRQLQLEYFDQPQLLDMSMPVLPAGLLSDSADADQATAQLEFIVHETGRTSAIRVLSAEPEWAGDLVYSIVAISLYRPRVADGKVVPAVSSYTWSSGYDAAVAAELGLESP